MKSPLPRWSTPRRKRRKTRANELVAAAQRLGFSLFPWQQLVADTALEVLSGDYVYRTVGVNLGRQNGKSTLIAGRIVMEALQEKRRIVYTAQDRNMARRAWDEHVDLIYFSDLKDEIQKITRMNGSEKLTFKNGSTYSIVTPSKHGGRGMSNDLVVIDEALAHDMEVLAALQPTLATRENGQLWLVSNSGNENSVLLSHFRNLGHSQMDDDDSRLAWFEWSPKDDKFDHLDSKVWRQAIPSLGQPGGVTLTAVQEAANGDPATFVREWLNVWPSKESVQVIDTEQWDYLFNENVVLGNHIVLGVDISRERHKAAIVASGKVGNLTPLEVVEAKDGTSWLLPRLIELATKWRSPVVVDAGGAAATIIPYLEQQKIHVIPIGLREYARACGDFYDAVQARTITHLGDNLLKEAIMGSSKRPLGDAWAWSRQGTTNTTPLVAATLARWGAIAQEQIKEPIRSKIF